MSDDREIQALLVQRLRSITQRAGGWARADPYVLHYLVAHAKQATPDVDDATATPIGGSAVRPGGRLAAALQPLVREVPRAVVLLSRVSKQAFLLSPHSSLTCSPRHSRPR